MAAWQGEALEADDGPGQGASWGARAGGSGVGASGASGAGVGAGAAVGDASGRHHVGGRGGKGTGPRLRRATAWGPPGSRPPPHRATLGARKREGGGTRHRGGRRCAVAGVKEMPGAPASAVARRRGRAPVERMGGRGAGGRERIGLGRRERRGVGGAAAGEGGVGFGGASG
jgi:hypothetical protein